MDILEKMIRSLSLQEIDELQKLVNSIREEKSLVEESNRDHIFEGIFQGRSIFGDGIDEEIISRFYQFGRNKTLAFIMNITGLNVKNAKLFLERILQLPHRSNSVLGEMCGE